MPPWFRLAIGARDFQAGCPEAALVWLALMDNRRQSSHTMPYHTVRQYRQSICGKILSSRSISARRGFVNPGFDELITQRREAQQMILDPLGRVPGAGPRAKNERPVARLRQQQFAPRLLQGPLLQQTRRAMGVGQFRHARLRHAQMRVNPLVAVIEPDPPVALLAPARRARRRDLLRRVCAADTRAASSA